MTNDDFTFLMCSERSGSNLILKMMNAHPQICGPTIKHLFNPLTRNYFRYGDLKNSKNWDVLITDVLKLYNSDFSKWETTYTKEEILKNINQGDLSNLISYFFKKETQLNDKSHVFVKEIKIYEYILFILSNFNKSKFIYQSRDPRDMAISWRKSKVHKGGLISGANQWKQDQQQFLKIHYHLLESNRSLHIKYEDLVLNSEDCLTSVTNFLGFNFESSMLNFHKNENTVANAKQQAAWSNLSKGVMKENTDKYLSELSDDEILFVEKICINEMLVLGYKPVNTIERLRDVSLKDIEEYKIKEEKSIERIINPGLKNNLDAMRTFYEKIL